MTQTVQGVIARSKGAPVEVVDIVIPDPGPNDVVVKVQATGVCHTDLGDPVEKASGYYRAPWQWQRIRDHQQWIGVYHSTDDPHVPVSEARFVAKQLRANYFEFPDRGHFVHSGEFPDTF